MQGTEIFRLMGKLMLDKTDYDKGVQDADKSGKTLADNLSGYMEKAKKILVGLVSVAAIKKAASAVWDLAKETSAAGDRIDKQSQALGLSRKAFQEWDYILAQSGASIDSMGMSMKTMNEAILSNSAETASGLAKLKLSAAQLQSMKPEEQFETIVRAFQKMPASAKKSQLAMQLFGRNAQSLMPLLNSSSDSIDELKKQAQDLGLIMSDEDVDASVAFGDALDDLSRTWTSFKYRIGAQFLPGLTNGFKTLSSSVGKVSHSLTDALKTGDWSGFMSTLTDEIGKLIPKAIEKLVDIGSGLLQNADKILGVAASIVGGLIDGIASAIPVLIQKLPDIVDTVWDGLKGPVTRLGDSIIDAINTVLGTNIPHLDVIVSWVQEKWAEVKGAFDTAADWVGKAWNDTVTWVQNGWNDINNAFNAAGEWVNKQVDTVVSWTQTKWATIKKSFADARAWAKEKREAAVDWVRNKWTEIQSAFTDARTWVNEKREAAVNWVMNAWESVQNAFTTLGSWVGTTAKNITVNFLSTVSEWIERIWKWLTGGGNAGEVTIDFTQTVTDWIVRIKNWLTGGVKNITLDFFGKVSGWVGTIYSWIKKGINVTVNFIKGSVESLTNDTGLFQGGEPSGPGWGESLEVNDVPSWGFAKGVRYVPHDGIAMLHKGETVLNSANARNYRNGEGFNPDDLYRAVASAVQSAVSNIAVNLDGKAVGNAVASQVGRNLYQQQRGRRVAAV